MAVPRDPLDRRDPRGPFACPGSSGGQGVHEPDRGILKNSDPAGPPPVCRGLNGAPARSFGSICGRPALKLWFGGRTHPQRLRIVDLSDRGPRTVPERSHRPLRVPVPPIRGLPTEVAFLRRGAGSRSGRERNLAKARAGERQEEDS